MAITQRQRAILREIWQNGPLSRWELHQRTGHTPNGVGTLVRALIDAGLLHELQPEPTGGGRPRIPLAIRPDQRHVIGLALAPGAVHVARINLLGQLADERAAQSRPLPDPARAGQVIRSLLEKTRNANTLGIGIGVAGFIDPAARTVLAGSAVAPQAPLSLAKALEAAGEVPVSLENDTQALAAQWMLTHKADASQDVLLVHFDEGSVSAALLVAGRPNRGCAAGANELGHTRFAVDTARCYCGQTGCLERICSGDFLLRQGAKNGLLAQQVERYAGNSKPIEALIRHLAMGLANAANLIRPHRLVLASRFVEHAPFTSRLIEETRRLLLGQIRDRMAIDCWDIPGTRTAETAAWLALADLYYDGWGTGEDKAKG